VSAQIFYGVGHNAWFNIKKWLAEGYSPVCFVDINEKKRQSKFIVDTSRGNISYDILSLEEAISKYPDYEIYPTHSQSYLFEIYNYLIEWGIPKERIKLFDGYEFRLGCAEQDSNICIYTSTLAPCCNYRFNDYHININFDDFETGYKKFHTGILFGGVFYHLIGYINPKPVDGRLSVHCRQK
jgi:hypothetical protein